MQRYWDSGCGLDLTNYYLQVVMCKEKATGEILAMKIHKKDVAVAEDTIDYILTEKRVLHTLQTYTHPFLLVCQS